jgi:ferredoxin--NADP+ reductase
MSEDAPSESFHIAIIGAGPASLYAAGKLSEMGHEITILNRDIKPGGLAEFGIYPNKYRMKGGLRRVFFNILERENVHYYGNVTIGESGPFTLEEVDELGFDAVVVAVGAQGTKWLGLPGEEADEVFHAKDFVYHYNRLPPFSEREFPVGENVCVVGLGNVCLDIVHWLVCEEKITSVTAVYRRGPAERPCTKKELRLVSGAMDLEQLAAERDRIGAALEAIGQDPEEVFADLTRYSDRELETESPTKFRIRFLLSPARIELDDNGSVRGLVCEHTKLVEGEGDRPGVERLGTFETVPCDTVVFAIGDSIEPSIGLPLEPEYKQEFATVPDRWEEHPERPRYMVYDPESGEPMWGTFVVGWARRASDGLVGKAKADAEQGCDEILAYLRGELERQPGDSQPVDEAREALDALLDERDVRAVRLTDVARLLELEEREAEERDLEEFKFRSQEKILSLLDV